MRSPHVFADLGEACEHAIAALPQSCGHGAIGFTYAITDGSGLVKFGSATDLQFRMKSIQTCNGSRIAIVGLCHDARIERLLHGRFRAHRSHGEWFDVDPRNLLPIAFDSTGRRFCYGCYEPNFSLEDLAWLRQYPPGYKGERRPVPTSGQTRTVR